MTNPQAKFEITASDETKAAVASVMSGLNGIGSKVGIVGAAITTVTSGAMAAFMKSQIDNADELSKLSQKMGLTTEAASTLAYAAKFSDVSNQQLAASIKALSSSMVDSQKAGSDQARIFDALGVSTTDVSGNLRAADDVMMDVAEAFASMPDGVLKTDTAVKLLGKSGMEMLPMLNGGRAGLEAMRKEAELTGNVISEKTGKAAEEFNDNMTRLNASLQGFANQALPPLLEGLNKLNELMGVQAVKPLPLASDFALSRIGEVQQKIKDLNDEIASINRGTHLSSLWGRDAEEIRGEIAEQQKVILEYAKMRDGALQAEAKLAKTAKPVKTGELKKALSGDNSGKTAEDAQQKALGEQQKFLFERVAAEQKALLTEDQQLALAYRDRQLIVEEAAARELITAETKNQMLLAMQERFNQQQGAALAAHEYGMLQQVTAEEQSQLTEEQRMAMAFSNRQMMVEEAAAREVITEERKAQLLFGIQEEHEKQIAAMKEAAMQRNLSVAADLFGSMAQLAQQGGERTFKVWKALAIAETVVSTYSAAQKAFESQLIPGDPTSPVRAYVAAAAAVAAGLARVVSINKTQLGSSSVAPGGAPSSGGVGGGGVPPVVPTANNTASSGRGNGVLQVFINGAVNENFVRDNLIPMIAEQVNSNDVSIISVNSRDAQDIIAAAKSG